MPGAPKPDPMRSFILFLCAGSFWLHAAALPGEACLDAGSLIGFIENHVQNALKAEDLNLSRYHAYKALNTLEKSREQMQACGCEYANKHLEQGLENLKMATRVSSLEGTYILLRRALENARAGRDALEEHDASHDGPYDNDVLSMNTADSSPPSGPSRPETEAQLRERIDLSLKSYENSLQEVVEGVPCREALTFVERIYAHCERQLLRDDLTPAKRYYNLRTKDLTETALEQLRGCNGN